MAKKVVLVDLVQPRTIFVVGFSLFLFLLACLLFAGVSAYENETYFAFDCKHDNHTWSDDNCKGVQMGKGEEWTKTLPPVNSFNDYFQLSVFPFRSNSSRSNLDEKLKVEVTLRGKNSGGSWHDVAHDDIHSETLLCETSEEDYYGGECYGFILVLEEKIVYSEYSVTVRFLNSPGRPYIGDVQLEYSRFHARFSILQVIFRLVFFFITFLILLAYTYSLRQASGGASLGDSFEQKFTLVLLVSLCFANNPFYGFQFLFSIWLLPFLSSVFQIFFQSLQLLFFLFVFDSLNTRGVLHCSYSSLLKLVLVFTYAILNCLLLNYISVRRLSDPVYSSTLSFSWIDVVYDISGAVYAICLIWVVVAMLSAMLKLRDEETVLSRRVLFVSLPVSLVILSSLVAFFADGYGSIDLTTNALGFFYFLSLGNVFVWFMAFGFWPAGEARFRFSNPSESSPLYDASFSPMKDSIAVDLKDDDFVESDEEDSSRSLLGANQQKAKEAKKKTVKKTTKNSNNNEENNNSKNSTNNKKASKGKTAIEVEDYEDATL